jgi:hypothetical protein
MRMKHLVLLVLLLAALPAAAQDATPAPVTPGVIMATNTPFGQATPMIPVGTPAPVRTPEAVLPPADDPRAAGCAAHAIAGFLPYAAPAAALELLLTGSGAYSPGRIAALNCLEDAGMVAVQGAVWLPMDTFAVGGGTVQALTAPEGTVAAGRIDDFRLGTEETAQNTTGITAQWQTAAQSVTLALCPLGADDDADDAGEGCVVAYDPFTLAPRLYAPNARVTIPNFYQAGRYALVLHALDDAGEQTDSAALAFDVTCTYAAGEFAAFALAACPPETVRVGSGAAQPFERGWMIWQADTGTILVLTDDGIAREFTDTFQESMTAETGDAPESLLAPVRGFARVWLHLGGADASGLGWATAPEVGTTLVTQRPGTDAYTRLVALPSLPDGGSLAFALTQFPGQEIGFWRTPGA